MGRGIIEKVCFVVDLSMRSREGDKTTWSFLLSTHRKVLDIAILNDKESENFPQRCRLVRSKGNQHRFEILVAARILLVVLHILPNSTFTVF